MTDKRSQLSRRDFLIQTVGSLGAAVATPALAQQAAKKISRKRKVMHIIGHSHIDAAWLWPWRDGSDTVLTTFRSALNRMSETPGILLQPFVFGALSLGGTRRSGDVRRNSAARSGRPLGSRGRLAG